MPTSYSSFTCLIPAGTTTTVGLNVANAPVAVINWRVPPGNRGHLSWYIAQSGVKVLPDGYGGSMVADGEWGSWTLESFPQSQSWSLVGTNGGTADHTVYLEFGYGAASTNAVYTPDYLAGFPQSDADIPGMWLT